MKNPATGDMFNALMFPQQSDAGVKRGFEALHESDNHTITFKQQTAAQ